MFYIKYIGIELSEYFSSEEDNQEEMLMKSFKLIRSVAATLSLSVCFIRVFINSYSQAHIISRYSAD